MTQHEVLAKKIADELAGRYENCIMDRPNAESLAVDIQKAIINAYRLGRLGINLRP